MSPFVAFLFSPWTLFFMGHSSKGIMVVIAAIIGIPLCLAPAFIAFVGAIEAYKTAERMQNGETVGENEYSFALAYQILRKLDSTATFARQ